MNLWDQLPLEINAQIIQAKSAATIKKNWRRHPAIRSTCLAKRILANEYGIQVISPWTAATLEYCAKYSGHGDPNFWVNFCLAVLDKIIDEQYSSDLGTSGLRDVRMLIADWFGNTRVPGVHNTIIHF